ncbi:MAG: ATP-binding cassette domain-containing protein [Flavobacteriales bacterium]|nr:ATP-binding cassette domain-containing protein [Flavobacteriales bacterium]
MIPPAEILTPSKRFWRLLKPDKKDITQVYVYSIFSGLISLSLPLGIQAIVNLIQGGQINTSWIVLVVIVIFGLFFSGLLQIMQMRITENLQQKIFTRAAFEFAYRIPRIRMEALYKHYAPELMNRFFDIISVQKGLSKILIDFSSAALQVIFGLILLCLYHPFFIIFSLVLITIVYAIFRFSGQRGLATSLDESNYKYKVAHWLEEIARTNMSFKLAGSSELPLEKTDGYVKSYLGARESHFKILVGQFSLLILFKVLVATGLLVIGGILVMNQQMNIGQFVAAEIIILLIMSSVEKLILSIETVYDILTSLEKIGQVTDLPLERVGGINLDKEGLKVGMHIRLEHVNFSYPGAMIKTLEDLNLEIMSGEKICLTGQNGSGKSTLLQILGGLYEPQSGSVAFNDLPFGNINLDSFRSVVGDTLSQEQIFRCTLEENVSSGRARIDFNRIKSVCDSIGLTDFIRQLPNGYNTLLDPGGRRLPRSIVQKILIARSIAAAPRLLLLENTMDQIEVNQRHRIIDFLCDSSQPWTMIAISSDPYFLGKADRVINMEDGKVNGFLGK